MMVWGILVPTEMPYANWRGEIHWSAEPAPVRKGHHKVFNQKVISITGGMTIQRPTLGYWECPDGELYNERMIPVRIACEPNEILDIARFAKRHYRQKRIMYYKVSDEVYFI